MSTPTTIKIRREGVSEEDALTMVLMRGRVSLDELFPGTTDRLMASAAGDVKSLLCPERDEDGYLVWRGEKDGDPDAEELAGILPADLPDTWAFNRPTSTGRLPLAGRRTPKLPPAE